VPALLEALRDAGMQHVLVVVGGIIPPQVGGACVACRMCLMGMLSVVDHTMLFVAALRALW
jgi:methylmalonyl-CoA mutase cobalamin-binding subunit